MVHSLPDCTGTSLERESADGEELSLSVLVSGCVPPEGRQASKSQRQSPSGAWEENAGCEEPHVKSLTVMTLVAAAHSRIMPSYRAHLKRSMLQCRPGALQRCRSARGRIVRQPQSFFAHLRGAACTACQRELGRYCTTYTPRVLLGWALIFAVQTCRGANSCA